MPIHDLPTASQRQFPKDPRDHAEIGNKDSYAAQQLTFEYTLYRLIARASSYFFSQLFCLI